MKELQSLLQERAFLIGSLYIIFLVLTMIGMYLVLSRKADNAGYSVIPMLFGLIFASLYHKVRKDDDR